MGMKRNPRLQQRLGSCRFVIIFFALTYTAFAADDASDPRKAKVMDQAYAESQVTGLTITNTDLRFGFDKADDHGRIVVATANLELSIPLRAISMVASAGGRTWEVKYQTQDGEAMVSGRLAPVAVVTGNSEFGSFALSLTSLKLLEFLAPGIATKPAKRVNVYDQDGRLRSASFEAVLTLTDGTRLQAAQLRRNQVSAQSVNDPMLLGSRPLYAVECTNYTDLRLLRGETFQTIPFENIKKVEFLSDGEVIVRARSGPEAKMKVPRRVEEILEGFNGASSRGDFYVPLKFVRSVAFGVDAD
jgi:hypothetical protein